MAVNEMDLLSEELPGWGLTEREVTWLWLFLESRESIQMDECQLNSQTMRNQIARALRRNPRVTRGLVRARDSELLPEEAFSWVEKSGRQPKWLAAQAGNKTGLRIRSSVFRTLTDREQLIALFDLWDRDFGQKESALKRLSDAWTEHARSDRIFSWFKDKDERTKCALAWSWLEKNKPRLTWRASPLQSSLSCWSSSTIAEPPTRKRNSTSTKLRGAGARKKRARRLSRRSNTTLCSP